MRDENELQKKATENGAQGETREVSKGTIGSQLVGWGSQRSFLSPTAALAPLVATATAAAASEAKAATAEREI